MNDANDIDQADDSQARERALDPATSFIVQAPAGSGKTELLTQRYLRLLACVNRPEEIIALTFTRKAAAEMRRRIVDNLRRGRDEAEPSQPHLQTTWQLARQALARDEQRGWRLLDNPARLFVRTIDSMCTALVRQMPVLSRSGTTATVTDRPQKLYRAAARSLLSSIVDDDEAVAPSLETLLTHLDNDLLLAETLLSQMLAAREQWLPLLRDSSRRAPLENALKSVVTNHLADVRQGLPAEIRTELVSLAAGAAETLAKANRDTPLRQCRSLRKLPAASADAMPEWLGLASLLLTESGAVRRRLDIGCGFPPASSAKTEAEKNQLADAKQRMAALLEHVSGDADFVHRLADLRTLPPIAYSTEQWSVIQALLAILPQAVAELSLVFQASGQMDFTEVALAAQRALGSETQPTDLALSLDYRIRHILVDEFQDTSSIQFGLLERLTEGWEANDGRTLFLVGDPMQSIYRFRKAEVGLFIAARQSGLGQMQPEPLMLSRNFRSQGALVDWFNAGFADAFPGTEDAAEGAVVYAMSQSVLPADQSAAVVVHPAIGRDNVAEARAVIAQIRAIREQDPFASAAVLVRSRSHLAALAPALKDAGLTFRAVDIEHLGDRQAVRDVDALTRALLHVADRTAWLAILRAPWCGLTLADLHVLAGGDSRRTVWQQIMDDGVVKRLSADGRTRLAKFRIVIARSFATRGRRRLRTLVEGTWCALGGDMALREPADRDNVSAYFDLLERLDDAGDLSSFEDLDEELGQLRASPDPDADDSLQVMTIHKAKGLEFDYVLLPGLDRATPPGERRLLAWLEQVDEHEDRRLLMAPINARGGTDPIQEYIRIADKRRDAHEQLRLLYVAVTRARKQLHLFGAIKPVPDSGVVPAPPEATLLGRLWPVVKPEFDRVLDEGATPATAQIQTRDGPGPATLWRLRADATLPELAPAGPWTAGRGEQQTDAPVTFQWASETARQVGNVVHRTMQEIARLGPENWSLRWLDGLQMHFRHVLGMRGVAPAELTQAAERATTAIMRTLADERGRWIIDPDHEDARAEFAVTGWLDNHAVNVVMDRTFVDSDGIRWVIDYKTGSHEGGTVDGFMDNEVQRYRGQLDLYARLMRRLDDREVRVALYFPMLQGWREWKP